MNSRQSKSFSGFLFAFMGIIALAFSVLVAYGMLHREVPPVDNVAQPN